MSYKGTYKDGEKDGLHTQWYENGQKESEETWKQGKENGLWIYWKENGKKSYEETWTGLDYIDDYKRARKRILY